MATDSTKVPLSSMEDWLQPTEDKLRNFLQILAYGRVPYFPGMMEPYVSTAVNKSSDFLKYIFDKNWNPFQNMQLPEEPESLKEYRKKRGLYRYDENPNG